MGNAIPCGPILDPGQEVMLICERCHLAFLGKINVKTIKGVYSDRFCPSCNKILYKAKFDSMHY